MRVVRYYMGERVGDFTSLETVMQYSLDAMETDHMYIQWMFPSNEPSAIHFDAPVLTMQEAEAFQTDAELLSKVKASMVKFLEFLGFELVRDDEVILIQDAPPTDWNPYPGWWMEAFNHNMLRVTRVLKCLRLVGLERYALALFDALRVHRAKFSENTFGHWSRAIMDPLW